jgi:hypothetical protein
MYGQILFSGQITATTATTVYTVPASSTVKVATMTVCNTTASPVTVQVGLIPSSGGADGTHSVVAGYSLAANDTLSLRDYLNGAMLGPGDMISVTAGTANALDVVVTGTVSS